MLTGTIDFYHFIPLSFILTLPGGGGGGGTRSVQSKTHWLHFLAHFSAHPDAV